MSEFDNRWDNWAGDFADSFAVEALDAVVRPYAADIVIQFGVAAKAIDPDFPDAVRPGALADALAQAIPRLSLPDAARRQAAEVVAVFCEYLRDSGRLGEGADWAAQLRVIRRSVEPRLKPGGGVKGVTIRRAANVSALGRNDPCPCGSGKKYKKCCMTA